MRPNSDHVPTTHAGSLPRPADLLELVGARHAGEPVDADLLRGRLREAVEEVVAHQAACGIEVVDDGEFSKPNFAEYVADRIGGLEGDNPEAVFPRRRRDFPEYFAAQVALPGGQERRHPLCTGPLVWRGAEALRLDIENLRRATEQAHAGEAFLAAPSPGILALRIPNAYYPSEEDYLGVLAAVLHEEYRAIADAGLVLQVDAPDIPLAWEVEFGADDLSGYRFAVAARVEALNAALEGIAPESVRCHVCWGNVEAPHTLDIPLASIVDLLLEVRAQGLYVEAANPRHAHEWALWRERRLPDDKVLVAGVIDSTTNFVEHPEVVAERIERFASVVGRERVVAGTDCGFGTFAASPPRVHPSVVWAKLAALGEGARIASDHLFA